MPLEPLTQSTEETPQGPLTLRVYPGKDCQGSLCTLDDGKTLAYTGGEFVRVNFSCEITSARTCLCMSESTRARFVRGGIKSSGDLRMGLGATGHR